MSDLLTNSAVPGYTKDVDPEELERLQALPLEDRKKIASTLLSSLRKTKGGGRPPLLKKCKWCKLPFSTRDMVTHKALCWAIHNPELAVVKRAKRGRPIGYRKPKDKIGS